jgi:hypothetical protein
MLSVNHETIRNISLALAALVLAAAAVTSASFLAEHPGADLSPLAGAENVIHILQGNETILWTSLSGSVNSYRVTGWPSQAGGNELGGALVIERPEDGFGGVIDFGEKPMTLSFELGAR